MSCAHLPGGDGGGVEAERIAVRDRRRSWEGRASRTDESQIDEHTQSDDDICLDGKEHGRIEGLWRGHGLVLMEWCG